MPLSDEQYAEQRAQWKAFWESEVAAGRCPHSGETIIGCRAVDLCDCFDVPNPGDPDQSFPG